MSCLAVQVDKLSPGREYQLRVRAGNACGWGPWAEPTHFTTEPDVPGEACCAAVAGIPASSARLQLGRRALAQLSFLFSRA